MKTPQLAVSACALLGATTFSPLAARAQVSDPEIKELISRVAHAYGAVTGYGCRIELEFNAGANTQKISSTLVFKKPRMLAAEVKEGEAGGRIVVDGKTAYTDSTRDKKQYLRQAVDTDESFMQAFAMSRAGGVGLLPILLNGRDIEKQLIPGNPTSVKKDPDETIDGVACAVVTAVITAGPRTMRYQFAFGKTDYFLRRLAIYQGSEGGKPQVLETHSEVTAAPAVTEATFKFVPAPGAVAAAPPKEPAMYDPRVKVGAVPLPISGKDLLGKPVSLTQYKGRVVLIDFWATWCGPCVAELPNVISAYNKYKAKGFDVLGISLDREGDRGKLTSFIKEHKMPWRQIYDGRFWQAANAKAYGVQSIPFTVLIGRDGKIAAVGARGEALAPAVEKALAKK
jgi:outer membrane lipoprotein-sorting protein/peroxiredoxin